MPPNDRKRLLDLEREIDGIKAEVIVIWHRVRRVMEDLAALKDETDERQSQNSLPKYRDELPSETKFSLHPTGIRLLLKNTRPSTFVVVVVVLGIVALVWLLRPR